MKRCICCGHELPNTANFCHLCASSQVTPKKYISPDFKAKRHKLCVLLISIGIVGLIALGVLGRFDSAHKGTEVNPPLQEPRPSAVIPANTPEVSTPTNPLSESEAQIVPEPLIINSSTGELLYRCSDELYRLNLSFYRSDGINPPTDHDAVFELEPGDGTFTYSQLFVSDGTGDAANNNFLPLVESIEIEAYPQSGGTAVRIEGPIINEDDPLALRSAMVFFNSSCDTNTIRWTIHMKNGDILSLQHVFTVTESDIEPTEPNISSYLTNEEYFNRSLTDDQLAALKEADIYTLQSQISTVADAVAYLDQFPHGRNTFYDALDVNLLMDIGKMIDLHRTEATGPDVYTCFTGWCLADDYLAAKYVIASSDSHGFRWIHHALMLPTDDGYHIVSPAGHSRYWNTVRGFDEKTISDLKELKTHLTPLHAGMSDDSDLFIYHLYVTDVGCETMNFWLNGDYLATDSNAKELYRLNE